MPIDIQPILSQYPGLLAAHAKPLGNAGGFSGARFWQLTRNQETLCLRRWPMEHPPKQHLKWIHDLLAHVHRAGLHFVPVPVRNASRDTICHHRGYQWEVAPWMPGRADFREITSIDRRRTRLDNAMKALAQWHNAASSLPPRQTNKCRSAPGMLRRLKRFETLCGNASTTLRRAVHANPRQLPRSIVSTSNELLDAFTGSNDLHCELRSAARLQVVLQPCIRDIWHDHVLFMNDEVSGFVDFGAARNAAREGDVARLLGSLTSFVDKQPERKTMWSSGLDAYQATVDGEIDESLVRTWHRANVSMSGLQWVEWLFLDARHFEDLDVVHDRMTGILSEQRKLS